MWSFIDMTLLALSLLPLAFILLMACLVFLPIRKAPKRPTREQRAFYRETRRSILRKM
jgi:hypothetical protein